MHAQERTYVGLTTLNASMATTGRLGVPRAVIVILWRPLGTAVE
jgi:hypothetical protein